MWGLTLWIALISLAVLFAYPKIQGTAKIVLHSLASLPFFTLVYLFIVNDDSILVVAANGGSALPLKYKIAATWAAREGPNSSVGWINGTPKFSLRREFGRGR